MDGRVFQKDWRENAQHHFNQFAMLSNSREEKMKRDLESTGGPCCSFSWFNHIWNEKFSNVHIPAVSSIVCVLF